MVLTDLKSEPVLYKESFYTETLLKGLSERKSMHVLGIWRKFVLGKIVGPRNVFTYLHSFEDMNFMKPSSCFPGDFI